MKKIAPEHYSDYILRADKSPCSRVYPLSIAEGIQPGDIYVSDPGDSEAVLFWHYCGFACICGSPSERFLLQLSREICYENSRRMLLMAEDDFTVQFFRNSGVKTGTRIEYRYVPMSESGDEKLLQTENAGRNIKRIDRTNIELVSGRITPHFSWQSMDRFLEQGFGFMSIQDGRYCGNAFSAAVSADEVDIGVEIVPESRGEGLASLLAKRMCGEILKQGKKPVWGHAETNIGSMRTAVKCGFVKDKAFSTIRIKEENAEKNGN